MKELKNKVQGDVKTIDDVIHLIEFIDEIQKPEQKLEELLDRISVVKTRKEFLDDLIIRLSIDDFDKFLYLLTYPKKILKILDDRRSELENERNRLSKMMDQDRKQVKSMISKYRKELDEFKEIGMYYRNK
jgi:hypothetical protein